MADLQPDPPFDAPPAPFGERDLRYAYDRGYWARADAAPRPVDPREAEGWDVCDEELAYEAKARTAPLRRQAANLARQKACER